MDCQCGDLLRVFVEVCPGKPHVALSEHGMIVSHPTHRDAGNLRYRMGQMSAWDKHHFYATRVEPEQATRDKQRNEIARRSAERDRLGIH